MKIFLSWSGDRSKKVAELLKDWLPNVIQAVIPWISSEDIERGSLWLKAINESLAKSTIGIICLTNENKNQPWILFESGALAKGLESSRVCTLLIDLKNSDLLSHPLTHFNHTQSNEDGLFKLLKTINEHLESPLPEKKLKASFDKFYPDYIEQFQKILKETEKDEPKVEAKTPDILEEVLRSVRNIENKIENKMDIDENIKREMTRLTFENGQLNKTIGRFSEERERDRQLAEKEFEKSINELKASLMNKKV